MVADFTVRSIAGRHPSGMVAGTGEVRIGCAGWGIPASLADEFPGEGRHLTRYARRFAAVEINSSFYRPHQPKTYAKWAAMTPPDFRFAVKFPRAVTHEARLRDPHAHIADFALQVSQLGDRLGVILVQLPPSLALDLEVAGGFFAAMRDAFDTPIVCEPRHASWFAPQVDDLWDAFDIGRVAADPARWPAAAVPAGSGRVHYWRLHGSPHVYYEEYGEERLRAWADDVRAASEAGHDCWVILDNTAQGHASVDAMRLEALLGIPPGGHAPGT